MPNFRKKPVVISAWQLTPELVLATLISRSQFPDGLRSTRSSYNQVTNKLYGFTGEIQTPEGPMQCSVGDWIITGVKGEKYPCKPDIFEATYEPVDAWHSPGSVTGL